MNGEHLPSGWQRPEPISQLDLFASDRDRILALGRISLDEVGDWRSKGWISFDASEVDVLNAPQTDEIMFIRNLARSGLNDSQIEELLKELQPPYQYDPSRTAHSFALGWVQIPTLPDKNGIDAFFSEHFAPWVQEKARSGEIGLLDEFRFQITLAVAEAEATRRSNAEVE